MARLSSLCIALLLLVSIHASAQSDGPYVIRTSDGSLKAWSVDVVDDVARKRVRALKENATIVVPAVGAIPSFEVALRGPADIPREEVKTNRKAPIFVAADTHGEFEILAQMLMEHRIVDPELRWSFGSGHLVVLGDVFDRGPNQREILWLLYALEAQAQKAGGGVHLLLGNHEFMILQGDVRYLNPKYQRTAQVLGVDAYTRLFSEASLLGQWLRTRASIMKIDQLLVLHGGVSPAIVERGLTLAQINSTLRSTLARQTFAGAGERNLAEFLSGPEGPLWYRGYFPDDAGRQEATTQDVQRIREYFGVTTVLVGHTRVPTITPLYSGAVIAVQVYPRRSPDGVTTFEALLVRDGRFHRARPNGTLEEL